MIDEQILEALRKIQIYCARHRFCEGCMFCEGCKFHTSGGACQIDLVLKTLAYAAPYLWELNKTKVALEK